MVTLNKKTIAIMLMAITVYVIISSVLHLDLCVFKNTTGVPCPGCGLTRATTDLLQLNWSKSLSHHALAIPVLLLLLLFVTNKLERLSMKWLILFLVIFLGYYIVRMVLFFPHEVPMDFNPDALLPRLFQLFKK